MREAIAKNVVQPHIVRMQEDEISENWGEHEDFLQGKRLKPEHEKLVGFGQAWKGVRRLQGNQRQSSADLT